MINYKELVTEENNSMFNVHDKYKDLSVEELKELCDNDRVGFSIGLINITGGLNVGGIIRSALMTGAKRVIIFGRKTYDARSAVGAKNYIDIQHYPEVSLDRIQRVAADYEITPCFVEQGGVALDQFNWLNEFSLNKRTWRHPFIIFGNENSGIPEDIMNQVIAEQRFPLVSIPQRGVLRSYNVASAASIVMYDLCNDMGWLK